MRNGPVPNVCVWFRARSSRFPEVGTHGCHCGNDRLPIARNWRFKHIRSHGSKAGNQRLPLQATSNSQRLELMPPNVGTKVTTTRNCQFQDLETYGSQPGNQRLPLQLPVPRGWNNWFPTSEPCGLHLQATAGYPGMELMLPNLGTIGYLCKNFRFLKVGTGGSQPGNKRLHQAKELPVPRPETYRSQPGNHWLPLQGTSNSHRLELMVPNVGTKGCHDQELPVPRP